MDIDSAQKGNRAPNVGLSRRRTGNKKKKSNEKAKGSGVRRVLLLGEALGRIGLSAFSFGRALALARPGYDSALSPMRPSVSAKIPAPRLG